MKNIAAAIITLFTFSFSTNAQTIAQARAQGAGATVTVTGIAINGSSLGTIRYLEDATAGIAVYGAALNSTQLGDELTVTGTLVDYNGLLEMNPITSFSINSNANLVPSPIILTPNILSDIYESELIEIDDATFANGGATFAVNTNYSFTSNGQTGQIRITGSLNPLIGTTIPTGAVNIVGPLSQYTTTYQILPRGLGDIINLGSVFMISNPTQSNVTTSAMDINWTTNIAGSNSYIKYGRTPLFELGTITGTNAATHTASITGANPADIFYVQAFSINGTDTAFSPVKLFATVSASTGNIKIYFDKSTEPAVALPGNNATTLTGTIPDTLIAYINRAKYTIDIAIYNFDNTNISNITNAINNAYINRSVRVRIISDGSSTNSGLSTLASGIDQVSSPVGTNYGIMHNKFMIIDAASADANDAILWTGSTNWTDQQVNTDANSVIIFQDQSIALGYQMEFEEMWGSTTATHSSNGKFGYQKTDNTPHEYLIGGKRVEQYFSPSDGTNAKILTTINTTDYDLYFAMFNFTRTDLAYGIKDHMSGTSIFGAGMVDDTLNASYAYSILQSALLSNIKIYTQAGLLHHKYLIVDEDHASSDPLVLAGSHNWTTAAETKNDENTVIIHDQNIANQYFQEFVKRFNAQTGGTVLAVNNVNAPISTIVAYPNPNDGVFNLLLNLNKNSDVIISVSDVEGRKIISENILMNKGANEKQFNLENYQKGIYIVTVSSDNFSSNVKMVVE